MVYTNGLWQDAFFMTGIMFIAVPLLLRKQLGKKRKLFFRSRKQPSQIENKITAMKGKCKNCGKAMESVSLGFCSQSCTFENYLLSQSKDPVIHNQPEIVETLQIKKEPEIVVESQIEKLLKEAESEIETESQPNKETPLFIRPGRTL